MRIFFLLTGEGLKFFFWIRDSQKFRPKSFDIHGWRKNLISDTKELTLLLGIQRNKKLCAAKAEEKGEKFRIYSTP